VRREHERVTVDRWPLIGGERLSRPRQRFSCSKTHRIGETPPAVSVPKVLEDKTTKPVCGCNEGRSCPLFRSAC